MNRLLMSLLLALFASVVVPAQETLRPRFGRFPLEAPPPNPAVVILLPSTTPTANTSSQINTISGTCTDDVECTSVTWACPECSTTSGTASGTAEWSFQVTLAEGANVVTVTPHDVDMNTPTTDVLTLTYTATDVTSPDIMITTPTSATTDTVSSSPYAIGGTSSDNVSVTSVTWVNAAGGSGTASGGTGQSGNWTASIALANGSNVITVTAHDQAGNTNIDQIDVTLTAALNINETALAPGTEGVASSRQMTASGGTGGNTWTNNGAGTTLNDSDADCAATSISSAGLVSWTGAVGEGTCTFVAKVTDSSMVSDTQEIDLIFQPAGAESAHTRYDLLVALPQEFRHLNFRSELSDLASVGLSGFNSGGYWAYEEATDSGKMTWPVELTNLTGFQQIKWTNVLGTGTDTYLWTWDVKWDVTWNHVSCAGGLLNLDKYTHKMYQWGMDDNGGAAGGSPTWELRSNFTEGGAPKTGDCAYVMQNNGRAYNNDPYNAVGVTDKDPFQDTGFEAEPVSTVNIAHSRWTRYVREIRLNQPHTEFSEWETECGCTLAAGTYHMGSDWVMDEIRGPIRIHYKVPLAVQRTSTTFFTDLSSVWFELDSSSEHPQAQGMVEFTGTPEMTIPKDAVLQNGAGTVRYQTNAISTIQSNGSSGPVSARATVSYDGPVGNAPVGTDLNFVNTPPTGVNDAVETVVAFTGGRYMWDGPPISWWRDAVVLKDYALPANPEDDTLIFRKPVP